MSICRHHLVAFTSGCTDALALRTAGGWLLPSRDKNPDRELPEEVHSLLSRMVTTVEVVHEAPLSQARGSTIDEFYFVASIGGPMTTHEVSTVPVAELLATPALLPMQREALAAALSRQQSPRAPFDSVERVTDALAWARERAADCMGARVLAVAPHRCARHEYVVRVQTLAGTTYFNGGRDRVSDAGRLTQLLWTVSPNQFPCTLAVDEHEGRWLYHELEGELIVGPLLTRESAIAAVRALAALQKRLITCLPVERHLSGRRMDAQAVAGRACAIAIRACEGNPELLQAWLSRQPEMTEVCRTIDTLDVPLSLVPSDFWGRNLLLTPRAIGFIDMQHAYWSLPWLPLLRFIHEVETAWGAPGAIADGVQDAFVSTWANVVSPDTMRRALTHLPLVGRLFNLVLVDHELNLRQHESGDEVGLPAWYRAQQLAPFIRRVLDTSALHGTDRVRHRAEAL